MRLPQLGDLLYCSWGYDQTNVDWYQVLRVSKAFVWLRRIEGKTRGNLRRGDHTTTPQPGVWSSCSNPKEPLCSEKGARRRFEILDDGYKVAIHKHYQRAYLWDGRPMYQTGMLGH